MREQMVNLKSKYIGRVTYIVFIAVFVYSSLTAFSFGSQDDGYIPKEGFVPDSTTAVKVAEAVWLPIFGNKIYDYKPFVAKLSEDKIVWIVEGSFHSEPSRREGNTIIHMRKGGVPHIEINKKDCKILKLYHGK